MRFIHGDPLRRYLYFALLLCISATASMSANATPLSAEMEYQTIQDVGTSWITVSLDNTYTSPIPVCTYVTLSIASRPVLTRVQNVLSQSFQLKIQEMTGGNNPTANTTPGTVHCVIAETGVHTLPDGRAFEAFSVFSDQTTGRNNANWNPVRFENVTDTISNTYTEPVILAGLITANDPQPSATLVSSCTSRALAPFFGPGSTVCVAKHTGEIAVSRADETIGVIIAESGDATSNDIYASFFTGDATTVNGVADNFDTSYSVSADFDSVTASQTAERGTHGGWATLTGANPLPSGSIRISIDEQLVTGSGLRQHPFEAVAVFAFRDDRAPSLQAAKTREVWDPSAVGLYALPSNDIAFTLSIANSGTGTVDPDTIFLVDQVPTEMAMYIGDYDESDGDTAPILFTETNSSLTFSYPTDVGFSSSATAPTNMAQCNHTPVSGYDANIRFICLNPKGTMAAGTPTPAIGFSYRAKIN